MNANDRLAYSIPEAATAVGCSVDVIRAAINSGQLTPRYITKAKRVIERDDLVAWIQAAPTERA